LREGESGSRQRGGDSFLRLSASSSPKVLSSTTISGSPTPPLPDDRLDEKDWRLILLHVFFPSSFALFLSFLSLIDALY
jgi:hypothetical protein